MNVYIFNLDKDRLKLAGYLIKSNMIIFQQQFYHNHRLITQTQTCNVMEDRHYHTIDPMILQTLNLNEKRMKRILDILHGNQPQEQPKASKINRNKTLQKDGLFLKHYQKVKSPQQSQRMKSNPRQRISSLSALGSPIKDITFNQQQKLEKSLVRNKQNRAISPSVSFPKNLIKKYEMQSIEENTAGKKIASRHSQLRKNYGQLKSARGSKSVEINPKDVYRLEIQALVSKPTQIQDLQDADAHMKRLKRRYQHLRKFDRLYYSKLNSHDFVLV